MAISFTAKARKDNASIIITVPAALVISKGLEAGEYYDFDIKLNQE